MEGPADLWFAGRIQNEVMKGLFIPAASFMKDVGLGFRMSETCLFKLRELSFRFDQIDPQVSPFLKVKAAFWHNVLTDKWLEIRVTKH